VDKPVGRLDEEGRLGGEGCDARPGVGQLLAGGGEVALEVGGSAGEFGGPGAGPEWIEPLIAPAAGLGQGVSGLLVRVPGGVSGRAQGEVFGVSLSGCLASDGVERTPQRRAVVEPARNRREFTGFGGQGRHVWAPAVGPVGELLAGPGHCASAEAEPARAIADDSCGRACGGTFAVPAREQVVADLFRVAATAAPLSPARRLAWSAAIDV